MEGFLNWKGSVFPSDAHTGSQLRKGGKPLLCMDLSGISESSGAHPPPPPHLPSLLGRARTLETMLSILPGIEPL